MRAQKRWIGWIGFLAVLSIGAVQPPEGVRFQIFVQPEQPIAGEKISLRLVTEKESGEAFALRWGGWDFVTVTAEYENGNSVPRTIYGRMIVGEMTPNQPPPVGAGGVASRSRVLKNGERAIEEFPLSQVFDMSVPGRYRIHVRRSYEAGKVLGMLSADIEIVARGREKSPFEIDVGKPDTTPTRPLGRENGTGNVLPKGDGDTTKMESPKAPALHCLPDSGKSTWLALACIGFVAFFGFFGLVIVLLRMRRCRKNLVGSCEETTMRQE